MLQALEEQDKPKGRRKEPETDESVKAMARRFLEEHAVGWERCDLYVKEYQGLTFAQRCENELKVILPKGEYLTSEYWAVQMVNYLPEWHPLKLLAVENRDEAVPENIQRACKDADTPIVTNKKIGPLLHELEVMTAFPNQRTVVGIYKLTSKQRPSTSTGARKVRRHKGLTRNPYEIFN